MAKLVDLEHKWAKELGRVMIAFGSIEWIVLKFLEAYPRDNIYASVRKMKLAAKLDLIMGLLKDGRIAEEEVTAINRLLCQVKKYTEVRNLIAHNPLVLEVYESEKGDLSSSEIIKSMHNAKRSVSYDQLQSIAGEVERLVSQMYKKFHPIFIKTHLTNKGS